VPPTDIDLDDALTLILDLQRLKGRHVEFHSNGDAVHARFDALAEVVNILMDNAATHGGSEASVVEVVRRDEETVDITVSDFGRGIPVDERAQVFEWGRRGSGSPGEGIGLHLARRLMTEDGGSLRLADQQGAGSSFVISLPAARRSSENLVTMEDRHAWLRSG
jgi:signal transduction histidine kinase